MWQEAMRRRRYLRDRAEEAGGGAGPRRSRDWLYESYYCMSQQHPLIVFLLLLVMGACLALLAVFFALRLVIKVDFITRNRTQCTPTADVNFASLYFSSKALARFLEQ